ncbi:Trypco2 domain-containing protein [Sulfidibacter corallicola]|uniref:Trypsin-co-occurring domain-containing protein n=1 Tax=Sulfidibacter corallicola TaxID=2818388 RepID=A0A8A4THC1_SULCO|nr:trypco2 family protein [Sulfidibacter corallicola]QTD48572.1 hypothetical protein J3U87_23575 [Sulfidibacter corallicola]
MENSSETETAIPLSNMVQALRSELEKAIEKGANQNIRFGIRTIELELKVAVTHDTKAKGGFKFLVVDAGADYNYKKETIQTIKLVLEPPVDTESASGRVLLNDTKSGDGPF